MWEKRLNTAEQLQLKSLYTDLRRHSFDVCSIEDIVRLRELIINAHDEMLLSRDSFGFHPIIRSLDTADTLCTYIEPDREMIIATILFQLLQNNVIESEYIAKEWGADVARLVEGLSKVHSVDHKSSGNSAENYRNLMLALASDIRVIIIMIIDRLALMKSINHHPDVSSVKEMAIEAARLYAPLAHMLGLYAIKGELEDMSLKYTNRDIYTRIAKKLNETKKHRDAYIAQFIEPVKRSLTEANLNFDIKGRTKSIYSIWNKMIKQHTDIENIYDLFAIRIIIDIEPIENESEKDTKTREHTACWTAFSIVTNMYQPNPKRIKDWLTVPKSNGYESLHTTVFGPDNKMVEVQIRTRRMDAVAERGVAAHWKYKGIRTEHYIDEMMTHVREVLEDSASGSGSLDTMRQLNLDVMDREVYVFTPKGDLYKLPNGATLLDFAFAIHSKLGCKCTGGKVNGKSSKLNYKLKNGDTIEIFTSQNQLPKHDWLNIVTTSKARNKIRQSLNDQNSQAVDIARELLQRRFKNRKIDVEEAVLMKLIKKLGYKTVTDFYLAISNNTLDVNDVIANYETLEDKPDDTSERTSAEEFTLQNNIDESTTSSNNDIFIIGDNVKGLNFKLSKCCNPVHGDKVFGFVSSEGVIKIHRDNCPNAEHIKSKYPYRLIATRWAGKTGNQFVTTLRIVGQDDIGIVTNITSIISKESKASLRNISIDSHDGIFHGYLVIGVETIDVLSQLIKKILTVKGVKNVERSN
ncbi:MAG: RelA/SpoT family protein [Paramuribaculum sp.]|nr:RelA/SpoT family protein [Paramuribaculum sp.]